MLEWKQYSHLHVVRNLRNLAGKWWNVDIFFLNSQGEFSTPIKENYFYNSFVSHLFKNESFKRNLSETLKNQTEKVIEPIFLEWKETGLHLLAVPVFKEKRWNGLVGAIGFVNHQDQLKTIQTTVNRNNYKDVDISSIKILTAVDQEYMVKVVTSFVQEIVMFYEMEKQQQSKLNEKGDSSNIKYGMVGSSSTMKSLYSFLGKIAPSSSNILIQGENGTGKELVAQAIYKNSPRKKEAFIVQNCSAFNDNLLESELFGHVKGAFTGAVQDKKGLFELAHKGTLFLDEIGDTSLVMQAKLLRVLQYGTFFPVGSVKEKKVDVRVIAATNKNIQKMIQQGAFREDLYYRLNVINIKLPALRNRIEDIPLLANWFLYQLDQTKRKFFDDAVIKILQKYSWPGNIRELQNEVQRMVILSLSEDCISTSMLSEKIIRSPVNENFDQKNSLKKAIQALEKKMIGRCLKEEGWNKTRVAKKLGISRAALISKVKTYDLSNKDVG